MELIKKEVFHTQSKNTAGKLVVGVFLLCLFTSQCFSQAVHHVKIAMPEVSGDAGSFRMGTAKNPAGDIFSFNSQYMLYNNKPVLPVMGEFHYSRYPDTEWRQELLKMKAGGIDIVSTYLFWIHHEEKEGEYNWSGQRNLGKFVQLCRELDFPLILRVGPWVHGESRNGGLPEWLVNSGYKLRSNDSVYLHVVNRWFRNIYQQVKGQMWKDGGTIVGIQLENEYGEEWEHLMALKNMVVEIGFDVPLYTRTGWPRLTTPATFGELIPLYGAYPDGFWDRSLDEMTGGYGEGFIFKSFRGSTVIATEQLPKHPDKDDPADLVYPYFTCELGGGMMTSYHRRVSIAPPDVFAMSLVRTGSGNNLPGYYMYHGGANPDGQLTTLNENQASNYTNSNDLPVKTYDFQSPLGEFGQLHGHYHLLRRMHLFLRDFGQEFAPMQPAFPEHTPQDFDDDSVLRWCVRSNGYSGYIFVNNYHRLKPLSEKKDVQFALDLDNQDNLQIPSSPVNIPAGSSFFLPFNLQIEKAVLLYATAQPIAKLTDGNVTTVFFAEISGIPAGFVFADNGIRVESSASKEKKKDKQILFGKVKPGTDAAIRLKDSQNHIVQIVLLSDAQSLQCWKATLAGKDRVFLSRSGLTFDGGRLQLDADINEQASVSIFPAPASLTVTDKPEDGTNKTLLKEQPDGLFTHYEINPPVCKSITVTMQLIREAGQVRAIKNGKAGVAEQPDDADFEQAAVWQLQLPENTDPNRDIYLRFPYLGDVARIYLDGKLLTDNFYNGQPFELGLKRFAPDIYKKKLTVHILPLSKDAPIYLSPTARPNFGTAKSLVRLTEVEVYEKQLRILDLGI
jgi:hypothetical protein